MMDWRLGTDGSDTKTEVAQADRSGRVPSCQRAGRPALTQAARRGAPLAGIATEVATIAQEVLKPPCHDGIERISRGRLAASAWSVGRIGPILNDVVIAFEGALYRLMAARASGWSADRIFLNRLMTGLTT